MFFLDQLRAMAVQPTHSDKKVEATGKEVHVVTTSPQSSTFGNDRATKDELHSQSTAAEDTVGYAGDNPFSDPEVAERYRLVYEKAQYECREYFDPDLTWTPEEEKQIVRRLDWRVCLWAVSVASCRLQVSQAYFFKCVMFFGLQVDRGNLSQAVSDNMLDDLKLTTNSEYKPKKAVSWY